MSCANWAAEVQDGDGAGGLVGATRWLVVPVAIGCRRVERDLEIRLDLGIVGCEDPMARVGERSVHGLAALA